MRTDGSLKKGANKVVKRPGRYNANIKKAEQQLENTAAALAVIQKEVQWVQEREKLLVDFIRCQEEVEQILQLQEQMMADINSTPDPAAAAAASMAQSVFGQVPCSNWSTSMAAKICVGHILAVQDMSSRDWCAAGCKAFVELSALLELCNRDRDSQLQLATGGGGKDPSAHSAVAAAGGLLRAAAAVADGAAADGSNSNVGSNGILQQAAAPGSAAPAGSAAASLSAAGATAPTTGRSSGVDAAATLKPPGPDATLKEKEESNIIGAYAAMFYHTQPYYAAAACNLSTAEVEIMPQQHLMQVVERLQLSEVQVMHLRIANTEFVRLARATSQEGESLAEQAAKLSLSQVLEHLGDKQPAAAAAAGSGAGKASAAENKNNNNATPSNGRSSHTKSSSNRRSPLDNAAQKAARAFAAAESERSTQTAAAAGAAAVQLEGGETPGEALSRQLDRYLRHMHIHTVVTAMCIVNTLTPRQMATLSVASFPYAPNVHALAEACMDYTAPQPPGPGEQRAVLWSEPWAQQVESHMQHRNAQLERQVVEWWRNSKGICEQHLRM